MFKTPIIDKIKKYKNNKPYSFHTPGHKNGRLIPTSLRNLWGDELGACDLTEIAELDNLHEPQGCIKEAQLRASQIFGAKETFFLVNGSSVGIHVAIMALAHEKAIFVPRHVHKSVYNALVLANAQPIYLPVNYELETGIPLGLEPAILEEYIHQFPACKVLILPNPNYQGISYKIEENIALAKKNGLQVIVDEAHGSHFLFHPQLPSSGIDLGADIIIQSWHKTLPVLTQASVLHIGQEYCGPSVQDFLNMLQTTSPSYLLLASLDACQAFMAKEGKKSLEDSYRKIYFLKKELKNLENLVVDFNLNLPRDFLKLNISSSKISGYEMDRILQSQYRIYCELAEENYLLFMFALKVEDKVLLKLKQALIAIDKMLMNKKDKAAKNYGFYYAFIPQSALSPQEAFYFPKEEVAWDNSLGRISGEFIIKYPPGIPLLVPGEIIDKKILDIIKNDKGFQGKKKALVLKRKK